VEKITLLEKRNKCVGD